MAKVGQNVITLVDHAKRLDPDGKVARIAELLAENNEIMNDIPFIEGNLPTGHLGTVRTGLFPSPPYYCPRQFFERFA